jgi:hypothetical protein
MGEVYWGTEDYNRRLYEAYLNQVFQLAIARFEWRGLPATVDPIWLERTLLCKGVATIAQPIKGRRRGLWYAAKMVTDGELNVYDRPSRWIAYSRELLRFKVTPKNGVIIYDNDTRTPVLDAIDLAVRELVDIQKTKQVNRFHQKVPYILVTDPDTELSADNLLLNIMSGNPATIANRGITNIETYQLQTQVPYLGAELTAAEQNVWNRIYTMLGIANVTYKSERMIEDEVRSMSEPATMMALSGLIERRRAADMLSDLTGQEVNVIWRRDNLSENVNALENVKEATKIIAGENNGLGEALNGTA